MRPAEAEGTATALVHVLRQGSKIGELQTGAKYRPRRGAAAYLVFRGNYWLSLARRDRNHDAARGRLRHD
ncbi:MAG: hypothetical protein PVSMB9_05870 [Candidatus Dormibacteria bacterium]